MSNNLVIVESPAKCKTLEKILGHGWTVMASYGHVRDLPKSKLGYDPDNNFEPEYVVSHDKKRTIRALKDEIDPRTTIYLATDDDREGHAIAWHLIPSLGIKNNPIKRIIFHEITKDAVLKAVANPIEMNQNVVDAQQARRILDRSVGYELSPLLWKKVRYGLSAGRVQSVTVRIVVDKEAEIEAFVPEEFWKVKALTVNPDLVTELVKLNGKTFKSTSYDETMQHINLLNKEQYVLTDIVEKDNLRKPPPPFTTSTIQQEASRKLGMSVKNTMNTAQALYEGNVGSIPGHTGGLITYMRTDSVNLSKVAIDTAKKVIVNLYGKDYTIPYDRKYKSKAKGAQEAHEGIRPVNMELLPSHIKPYVDSYHYRLYNLIWNRTIATQMADAKVANTKYIVTAGNYEFVAKGQRIVFPGFMKSYTEGNDTGDTSSDKDTILPTIKKGTVLEFDKLTYEQNFTKPPARYTEASLVKKLENEGIGRPSTYASTISSIMSKSYVITNDEKKIVPTEIGKAVTGFMKDHFPNIVDLKFTANIENEFDSIADGELKWQDVMRSFYTPFKKTIIEKENSLEKGSYLQPRVLGNEPGTENVVTVSIGKFGPFAMITPPGEKSEGNKARFANIHSGLNKDTITLEEALELFKLPRTIGEYKGDEIIGNIGRFGPYIRCKKSFYNIKDHDIMELKLETAVSIIEAAEEERKKNILREFNKGKTLIVNGNYGPYIKDGKSNIKLPKGTDIDNVTEEEINEIIKNAPKGKKKGGFKKRNR